MIEQRGRLIAVNDVEIEARSGIEEKLCWFYDVVAGLPLVGDRRAVDDVSGSCDELRFRSDRLELRIHIVENPAVVGVDRRVHVAVGALKEVCDLLDEDGYEYSACRGMRFTDRYLSLLDPAGNRVEFRRDWPMAMV